MILEPLLLMPSQVKEEEEEVRYGRARDRNGGQNYPKLVCVSTPVLELWEDAQHCPS